ncbi:methyltransferase domain-containing protein [Microvirga sp. 2MCAF38]|uniref:class I SAM-dependent methyltransferase n=1 Tax=Microvirga sp. 2MCAF38 TaxID=3232989 RepID=UPI003F955B16
MSDERIHFEGASSAYNAMLAAEHVARYYCVRDLCRGKRVLDVACGEGYGSFLLAEWGAAEVVGVDISSEAVATAERVFGRENISFVQGDACKLHDTLRDADPFDLIVSFETLEHVPDVGGLLSGFLQFRTENGAIVVSCPNDQVEETKNPYHLGIYTFDELQKITTSILGPATQWLFGTPTQGYMLYPAGHAQMENVSGHMSLALQCAEIEASAAVPAQSNIAPNKESCRFFIGAWGTKLPHTAIVAPLSFHAFMEPWLAITFFKEQNSFLLERSEAKDKAEKELANVRRRGLFYARQANILRDQIEQIRDEYATGIDVLRNEYNAQSDELTRWYEFQQSRSYKASQLYQRVLKSRGLGSALRLARRIAAKLVRSFRPC